MAHSVTDNPVINTAADSFCSTFFNESSVANGTSFGQNVYMEHTDKKLNIAGRFEMTAHLCNFEKLRIKY